MLRWLSDSDVPNSFANKLRAKRFRQFEASVAKLPQPVRILDVGGTNAFWENRGWHQRADVEILTVNLVAEQQRHANIKPLAGDATDLAGFGDHSVDIVFSNSVIEHLFTFEKQRRMASEIQRVGKAFWVQTPNFWFPMEPHFHFIGWQWLPVSVRTSILQRRACGWRGPCPDPAGARRLVEEIRLLTRSDMQALFPGATIIAERFCGFVKSWSAVSGFH
jgi:Methyltransferase domain